jgi:hypothetical protein
MSDRSHQYHHSPGAGLSDAAADFMGALAEIWGKGMTAWQEVLGAGPSPNREQSFGRGADPLVAMLGPMASIAASFSEMLPRDEGMSETSRAAFSQFGELSPAILEAAVIAAASTLRYWRALADIFARYQSSITQAAMDRMMDRSAMSPAECRALADALRAFLREVGEAASQEARRLQSELEQVSESIARATLPDEQPPSHRRRHRVKE